MLCLGHELIGDREPIGDEAQILEIIEHGGSLQRGGTGIQENCRVFLNKGQSSPDQGAFDLKILLFAEVERGFLNGGGGFQNRTAEGAGHQSLLLHPGEIPSHRGFGHEQFLGQFVYRAGFAFLQNLEDLLVSL